MSTDVDVKNKLIINILTDGSIPTNPSEDELYFVEQEELAVKANISMDNLTDDGKNISTWSTNITNCLKRVPQNIKLELSNGTLALKAGSKIYIPNGLESNGIEKAYSEHTLSSDLIVQTYTTTGKAMVIVKSDLSICYGNQVLSVFHSGTTPPTSGIFYNTSTNYIDYYLNSSISDGHFSFPIGIVTIDNGSVVSIDSIFNGFGYIGSTMFVLPGVKGRIPDGRNADGSLKNIEYTTREVIIYTDNGNNSTFNIVLQSNGYLYPLDCEYDDIDNIIKYNGEIASNRYIIGKASFSSSKITSFIPKTVFHALDYNDKTEIVGWGMPDYSAGVAISFPYTCPTDGVIIFVSGVNSYGKVIIDNTSYIQTCGGPSYTSSDQMIVCKDSVLTSEGYISDAKFYPLKGVKNA